ncbi:hypothetical protein MPRM_39270 [Mycobacterium parmense]|uniref:Vegetative cell wall protein n=1 Tax=Mycobacterium parmense TaxID=185642 RepID=A0A7I7YXY3_9MYCO|nr:hypothetical protein MPRM_39270 [Mycobacterium parmense]
MAIPAFSSPVDCTPWVTGGLWPAELSTVTAETATLAEYLRDDLQRIADRANDELKIIKRAGLSDSARQAEEAGVIDDARARAVRRVESTLRQLDAMKARAAGAAVRREPTEPVHPEPGETQIIPAVKDPEPDVEPVAGLATATDREEPDTAWYPPAVHHDAVEPVTRPHIDDTQVIPAISQAEPAVDAPGGPGRHHALVEAPAPDDTATEGDYGTPGGDAEASAADSASAATESDAARLNRLLEFVVRQESRLNWAVGDRADGTTLLVTDLAHGWIPGAITLPAGVRLLPPGRRTGRAAALIGDPQRLVTYAPGDFLRRTAGFAATHTSLQPRELPAIDNLRSVLGETTHWRDGLPRIVYRLANAAATGETVVDQEIDVLRVHLDTARYQLLVQYPNVDQALLLNCMLMAATERMVSGDPLSANYHLAWYRQLVSTPADQ